MLMMALLCLAGCSIKEDRHDCPAWLGVRLSSESMDLATKYPVRVILRHASGTDSLFVNSDLPQQWAAVERGNVHVEGRLANGAGTAAAWGVECDSLWVFKADIPVKAEEERVEVLLHKRFATVYFSFDKEPDERTSRIRLRSVPKSEEYCCLLKLSSGGETSVRLPEHGKDSVLELECLSALDSRLLWDWDLGEALLKAGYDWGADDLADARVRVSLAPLEVHVEIIPWTSEEGLVLEI